VVTNLIPNFGVIMPNFNGDHSVVFFVSVAISNSLISVHFGWKRLLPVRNQM
jgi:hypothetical protein